MAVKPVNVSGSVDVLVSVDDHGPEAIYNALATSDRVFITTFNLPTAGGRLLGLLEGVPEDAAVRFIAAIPGRWDNYFGSEPRKKARITIGRYVATLARLAARPNAEVYFCTRNHAKVMRCDDLVYIGSSNFTDASASNIEAGVLIRDAEIAEQVEAAAWETLQPHVLLHPGAHDDVQRWATLLKSWMEEELAHADIDATYADDIAEIQARIVRQRRALVGFAADLVDAHDDAADESWPTAVATAVRGAVDRDRVAGLVQQLESRDGPIDLCTRFRHDLVVERLVTENCADEETLEEVQEAAQGAADAQWEDLLSDAREAVISIAGELEEEAEELRAALSKLCENVDNT